MGTVNTNSLQLSFTDNKTDWNNIVPSGVARMRQQDTTTEARVIDKNRQNLKSKTTSIDSGVEYSVFLSQDGLGHILEPLFFAKVRNAEVTGLRVSATDAADDSYTVSALDAAQAGLLKENTLLWASGFTDPANNGLKSIDTDASDGDTEIAVAESLAAESGASGRMVSFNGYRIPAGENPTWTYSSIAKQGTLTVSNANDIPGLHEGQKAYIGSIATDGGDIQNSFRNAAANDIHGVARVRTITSTHIIFDELQDSLKQSASGAASAAVDIVFGRFGTNVPRDSALFSEVLRTYEMTLPNYAANGDTLYRYSDGNRINTVTMNVPAGNYATLDINAIGASTAVPVATRRNENTDRIDPLLVRNIVTTGQDTKRVVFSVNGESLGLRTRDNSITFTFTTAMRRLD